jgi:3'(2'), 5'-bisphosphate nucleotidase
MTYDAEKLSAMAAVRKACILCEAVRSVFRGEDMLEKKDKSPVTVADFGAQAVVSQELSVSFPADPLVAEEDSGALRDSRNAPLRKSVMAHVKAVLPSLSYDHILGAIDRGAGDYDPKSRFWTLDPIDGTKGYLRGDQYAVALALVEEARVVLGVLGCPHLPMDINAPKGPRGCLFSAVTGEGAVMEALDGSGKRRISVAETYSPSEALFCESFESSHSSHQDCAEIGRLLQIDPPPVRMDSQCKYGMVARGDASVYLRLPTKASYMETIWDHAAGSIIVEEAGGKVTDMEGRPLDFSLGRRLTHNKGIVVTNGSLHNAVLGAVKEVVSKE